MALLSRLLTKSSQKKFDFAYMRVLKFAIIFYLW